MSRRYEGKSDEDLILDDKLDIASTIITLRARCASRKEKNRVLTLIKQSHREEVNNGEVIAPALPDGDAILGLFGANAPALSPGGDTKPEPTESGS